MDIFSCWIGEQEKEIRNIKPTTTVKGIFKRKIENRKWFRTSEHIETKLGVGDTQVVFQISIERAVTMLITNNCTAQNCELGKLFDLLARLISSLRHLVVSGLRYQDGLFEWLIMQQVELRLHNIKLCLSSYCGSDHTYTQYLH